MPGQALRLKREEAGARSGARLIIIAEDAALREMLAAALEQQDLQILTAAGVAEGTGIGAVAVPDNVLTDLGAEAQSRPANLERPGEVLFLTVEELHSAQGAPVRSSARYVSQTLAVLTLRSRIAGVVHETGAAHVRRSLSAP